MRRCILLTLILIIAAEESASAAGPFALASEESIDLGRRLFAHNWSVPESWTGPEVLGNGGDGLGPMFNATSCIACHHQSGAGGSGGNEHNVEVLSVVVPRKGRSRNGNANSLMDRAHELHPLFSRESASFVLHHHAFDANGELLDYSLWRDRLTAEFEEGRDPLDARHPRQTISDVPLEIAYRNTPALWGLGLIEQIRSGNGNRIRAQLVRIQASRQPSGSPVSGRIPRTPTGEPGWYGWRGHVGTLRDFVLNACAAELGLEVPGRSQPANPLTPTAVGASHAQLDLTSEQVTALTAYVAHLPRPVRVAPGSPLEREAAVQGEKLFHQIGCAECHVEVIDGVEGLYSDLLLHDLGPDGSDQATAIPERLPAQRVTRPIDGSGYSGGGSITLAIRARELPTNIDQEWQTPPLWGIADSAPYMHDGKASTLDEAVRMHDGEASLSAHEYDRLFDEQRQQVISFLRTLRAPQVADAAAH